MNTKIITIKIIIIIILLLILLYMYFSNQIKFYIISKIIVLRGILAPNCFWWKISELFIKDASAVELYNRFKESYGDFALTTMFGKKIYIVTNNNYIRTILDNSPNIFGVGELKYKFFKSFMSKNVGVSQGCPWKRRRKMNEQVLLTDKIHTYARKHDYDNKVIIEQNLSNKNELNFNDFIEFGKRMASKVVFNEDRISDDIFAIFSEANSISALNNPDFKIDQKIFNTYTAFLKKHIQNPNEHSLVKLCTQYETDEDEIIHQIPHFIFPIVGLYNSVIPRLLLFLCNHPRVFQKVIKEIKEPQFNNTSHTSIYKLEYLRKCILETLRLNNPVVTTFRTLLVDFEFDQKYKFKKGTQFLILNNPVLREKEFFTNPNKFIPERWTSQMEKSYYAISFNQGPQRCPGKELAIFLCQNFIVHFFMFFGILENYKIIKCNKINTEHMPQMINPCGIKFYIDKK